MSVYPSRPRLLMSAAAIMVANGGGKAYPLDVAKERERVLESARTNPAAGSHEHSFQLHISVLADLIVSINASNAADPVPLTVVK